MKKTETKKCGEKNKSAPLVSECRMEDFQPDPQFFARGFSKQHRTNDQRWWSGENHTGGGAI